MTDWMQHGSCLDHPADWWFPEHGNNSISDDAKRICQTCPVQAPCLDYALTRKEEGVWGGLTATERRILLRGTSLGRPRSPIVHGTERGYKAHKRRGEQPCADCSQAASEARRRREAA